MSAKRRVLHVVTSKSWRGGEQQAAYLIQELKQEVDNLVLCSKDSEFERFCEKHGIRCFTHTFKRSIDLGYSKTLKNICVNERIDICHLHDAHALTYAVIAADFYRNKTPLILSRRVDFPINNNWFSKYKYNHPSIGKILCVSQKILEIASERIKDKSKLRTVYSGIDLDKFKAPTDKLRKEFRIPSDAFLVGNTSALADHKDYFTFIDVVEKLQNENGNYCFVIMGDGPLKEEILHYAESKTLTVPIVFTGFRNDVPEVLGELDAFLITSKTEGLGTSILDAFACLVPVVATKAGGIPELVVDQQTGLLCEVKDVNALADAVIQLKIDASLRAQIIENAALKVKEFDKKNTARKTLEEYKQIFNSIV